MAGVRSEPRHSVFLKEDQVIRVFVGISPLSLLMLQLKAFFVVSQTVTPLLS